MLSDNAVLAIGGNQGDQVWFLTSKYVPLFNLKERLEFRRLIIEYRNKMLSQYESIWNFVWVGNKSHIRFLKTIGAVFHNEFIADGQFQLFTISRR
ncbi:internal capsid protein A [Erwinia phage phiEF2]